MRHVLRSASLVVVSATFAGYLLANDGLRVNLLSAAPKQEHVATELAPISSEPPPAPVVTPINALLIGDSVLAELRWFEHGTVSLQGFTYTLDAESCRRIALPSCAGRENRTPESAATVVANMTQTFDVIVLLGGYHASTDSLRGEIGAFVEAASAKATKVVIVNYRESLAYPSPYDATRSTFADFNDTLRAMQAEGALGKATIADWNSFTLQGASWFRPDAMHPNIAGTLAMGWFISATLASMYNNPCPVFGTYPCVVPTTQPDIDWLTVYGLPYTDMHCYEDGPNRKQVCERDRRM